MLTSFKLQTLLDDNCNNICFVKIKVSDKFLHIVILQFLPLALSCIYFWLLYVT